MPAYTLHIPAGADPDKAISLALRAAQTLGLDVTATDDTGTVVLRVTRTPDGLWGTTWLGPPPDDDED